MNNLCRDPQLIVETVERWLSKKIHSAGAAGGIVGLSGGIDSALLAVLLKRVCGDDMLAVMLPCHSCDEDREHAELLIQQFQLPSTMMDISLSYDALLNSVPDKVKPLSNLAIANIKPRLRMTSLYLIAQTRNYLVCGTGNKAELTVGYFTKHGDSGVDLLPLGDLLKHEVREVSRYLGVPDVIIDKPPSAGLWQGQTDEEEMGFSYYDLDRYIATGKAKPDIIELIEKKNRISDHKRKMPAICRIL